MLGRNKRTNGGDGEDSFRQPLLHGSQEDLHADTPRDNVLFTVDDVDDDDYLEGSALEDLASPQPKSGHSVRFNDDIQVIAPPMRSMAESREAEYELDTDDLDDEAIRQLEVHQRTRSSTRSGSRRDRDQAMPLLVGLADSAVARRSLDGSLRLEMQGDAALSVEEVDLEELAAKKTAGGGMLDSIANMANSILGAGIIGLPYAVRQAGFVTGLVLLVILCGVTDWTIRLIVLNAKLSGRSSYIEILNHCFGPSGRAAVSLFQFAFAFGGMCAFGIIIGDTIPHVVRSVFPNLHTVPVLSLLSRRQPIIALCTICVSYPLSLYRDIHKLSRASGLALVGMIIIVTSVLIESQSPSLPLELKGDPKERFTVLGSGVFQAIGVISFAFVCHHNSLLIYGSLRTPTLDRFARVTHVSTVLSLVSCVTLAVAGYLVFTDKTQGNILNNFAPNDTLINVARFCFGLNMFTTLPLELFVCREVVEQYFFPHEPFSMQRHVFFTTVILFSAMFLSLVTCDLGVMLEITGGVSATALAFIFPAACYLKLLQQSSSSSTPSESSLGQPQKAWSWHDSRRKVGAVVCVVFGVIVMCISMVLALGKVWKDEGQAKICSE